ncbi:MAG: molybdopterin synthase sulfur carrier subunit [Parasphingorhabdus sp.]|jgi:molybdopterin synthase sulfur carrier subunit
MQITLKLFASLGDNLPGHAKKNAAEIEVENSISLNQLIDTYQVPRELAHLVLVNGIFYCEADRDASLLKEGDTVAIWPPVAGG